MKYSRIAALALAGALALPLAACGSGSDQSGAAAGSGGASGGNQVTIHVAGLPFDALVCGPLAAALVVGVLALEAGRRVRFVPAAVLLGDASYSIYLWHTFAISVIAKVGASMGAPAPAVFAIAVLAGTSVGVHGYFLIERQSLLTTWRAVRAGFSRAAL